MPLGDAIGSVLARDATAPAGLPRFDNAAMDGFAVRSADLTAGGTGSDLKVTAIIAAGEIGFHEIGPGQAARIMTGAMIPKGADRVVVQENARMNGDRVRVFTSASDKPHIRRNGTDQLLAALVSAAGDHDLIVTWGSLGRLCRSSDASGLSARASGILEARHAAGQANRLRRCRSLPDPHPSRQPACGSCRMRGSGSHTRLSVGGLLDR